MYCNYQIFLSMSIACGIQSSWNRNNKWSRWWT